MFGSRLSSFSRGQSSSATYSIHQGTRTVPTGLRRWTRAFYITLPILLLLNYLLIFHFTIFEKLSRIVFPDHTFHPLPFLSNPHEPTSPPGKPAGDTVLDYWTWKTQTQFAPLPDEHDKDTTDLCAIFPTHLLSKIQVVLKVGAADHWTRTSSQVNGIIKCIPNAIITSDRDHAYGVEGIFNATDILADLPPSTYLTEEDLAIYESQKNASLADLRQGAQGWRIDKYKFLPAVEYAVEQNHEANWYVFIESDTYVFWDNVFRLLEHYDESMPYYFGSPSPGRKYELGHGKGEGEVWFAYGGAGYILSSPAAHRLVDRKKNALGITGPRVTEEYKEDIQKDCCGDSILGWALHDKAGVDISGLWPMFNPMSLHELPFGRAYWCEPVLTMHKSHAEDLLALWEWENRRDRTKGPLMYRDLLTYQPFFHPNTNITIPAASSTATIPIRRIEDWHNAYLDTISPPTSLDSFDACAAACHAHNECWQFTWHAQRCHMSSALRLGEKKDPDGEGGTEEERRYISGWDVEKVRKLWEEKSCEGGARWVKPSVKRRF
ncbi:glycosyltransferase family 31 protein [Aaosphaeria arxii CBS 175.79]|uniref:N-acetylgalactosaminide beta-1,3-galactosyltransferase n=1 Tax=Aaosphaeria arxii CBS 175.79 TaxID=1450172 RepID=A0A6A5Y6R3_9PLEO|nr:glycosyltransferase family 31 protein [Aaosphaeria arxii CBS 175.79]KAF2020979.1 glycosyltransferase family 31 protein [Aaosphaeria arxii CBS 175.79]